MSETYQSLSPSKWDCQYHVVFVPNGDGKPFSARRRPLGAVFHTLARQKECHILEGRLTRSLVLYRTVER